jgi:hypothetical protein
MTATLLVAWAAGLAQPAPDAPLRQLQTEIRDVAKVQVELLFKDMEKGPGASYTDTAAAVRRLADAEADLGDPAAAVKWAERWVESLKKREEFVKKLLERGTGSLTEFLHVVIARINAEIEFIRRQEAVKGGPRPDPARKLALYEERVKMLTAWEQLIAKAVVKEAAERAEMLALHVARLDAAIELAKLKAGGK